MGAGGSGQRARHYSSPHSLHNQRAQLLAACSASAPARSPISHPHIPPLIVDLSLRLKVSEHTQKLKPLKKKAQQNTVDLLRFKPFGVSPPSSSLSSVFPHTLKPLTAGMCSQRHSAEQHCPRVGETGVDRDWCGRPLLSRTGTTSPRSIRPPQSHNSEFSAQFLFLGTFKSFHQSHPVTKTLFFQSEGAMSCPSQRDVTSPGWHSVHMKMPN